MGLNQDQVDIIKATVPVVKEHGNTITSVFYKNLLSDNPDLNNIFNTSNQVNGHQPRALATALYAYAANIENLAALGPFIERVCHKHASLYIRREQYDIVGKYLLAAMHQILGTAFTPEVRDAWTAAYYQLADIMAGREEDLYSSADSQGWTDWHEFRIHRKEVESPEITSFYLTPVDGMTLPSFLPGQYISVQTPVPSLKYLQSRQYSLSDAPNPNYYRISVKRESGFDATNPSATTHPGYISNVLHDLKNEGDIIQVSHPRGEFYLPESQGESNPTDLVLISAGVGITPMISIVNTILNDSSQSPSSSQPSSSTNSSKSSSPTPTTSPRHITHIHTSRHPSDLPFTPTLTSHLLHHPQSYTLDLFFPSPASASSTSSSFPPLPNLKIHNSKHLVLNLQTDPNPNPDPKTNRTSKTEYYICGPPSFMTSIRDKLVDIYNVEESNIKLELFGTGGI